MGECETGDKVFQQLLFLTERESHGILLEKKWFCSAADLTLVVREIKVPVLPVWLFAVLF
jgi:hypothetical protein